MRYRIIILLAALLMPFAVQAQWRAGTYLGASFNMFSLDRQHRVILSSVDYRYRNTYLQLPVMASFSFGGQEFRGFCNLGVYGGVWLDSRREGTDYNYFSRAVSPHFSFNERVPFNQERDCRWDFGFLGGLGAEYRFALWERGCC